MLGKLERMNREYHVAKHGCDRAEGTKEHPFRTISKAAFTAERGDRVVVHEGEYREWVKPVHSGYSDISRIVYEAAEGEKVVIKGSEQIKNWENVEGTVWKAVIPNSFFGDYNPYAEVLQGDWFVFPSTYSLHAGDVYLNGTSFYEAESLADVKNPTIRKEGFPQSWFDHPMYLLHPEDSIYRWYSEVDTENTTIYANFHETDPNKELVEINVRKCCFYPERSGINYITVRGFEMAQAACTWAPPTADQVGLLGAHWSKGWIIEHNKIHDAKCSGISIGKEISTGNNLSVRRNRKPGYQSQLETVFMAKQIGWSKENIGAHIIRNNIIYDCGQNGIVGHLGCVFSQILDNEIYNIGVKQEFFGYEIAGIKLHAAIDVQICHNYIHHCTMATWLDWEAQGTRISKNLYRDNELDLMVEVTHGPCLIDHNIFTSDYCFDNIAQGSAFVHNLCCGILHCESVLNRSTPYHVPHSTDVAGVALVYGGDDRYYQNIFVGGVQTTLEQSVCGTALYDGSPSSWENYQDKLKEMQGNLGVGGLDLFVKVNDPVYIDKNVYLKGAEPFEGEEHRFVSNRDPKICLVEKTDGIYLEITVEDGILEFSTELITTQKLGEPRISEGLFENPDRTPITLNSDFLNQFRGEQPIAGPLQNLKEGFNCIRIWEPKHCC